jgi:hypothetical protein
VSEHDFEPIRGLPGNLPAGEHILWQGAPDAWVFARSALNTRWIAGYFGLLIVWAMVRGTMMGVLLTAGFGAIALALSLIFAFMVAKTTVYTITNRRVVLRIGVALSKCINLPLSQLASADLREQAMGFGDIALVPAARSGLGYALLWPHARPLRLSAPQPMLRAIPNAAGVAGVLAKATAAIMPVQQRSVQPAAVSAKPVLGQMGAAA